MRAQNNATKATAVNAIATSILLLSLFVGQAKAAAQPAAANLPQSADTNSQDSQTQDSSDPGDNINGVQPIPVAVPVTVATPQPLTRPVASSYVGELSSRMGSRLVGITSKATPVAEAAAIPAMLSFGDVTVGQTGTNTLTVSNSGKAQLTISQITLEGSGFSVSRSLPISVDAGGQTTINFLFKPTVAGNLIGQLSIMSNAVNSTVTIPMTATGVATKSISTSKRTLPTVTPTTPTTAPTTPTTPTTTPTTTSPTTPTTPTNTTTPTSTSTSTPAPASTYILNASSTSLSFGSVNIASSGQQTLTLTNAGNANITISNVIVSGAGFNASGVSAGTVLTPGQSVTLTATFAPASTGNASGSISISNNSSNGTETIALSGTGAPATHSVQLSWSPSTSNVIGYNVYVSNTSDGSYSKLTPSPNAVTSYTDGNLQTAQTRYYVVTSVNSSNQESAFSSQVSAIIP